jgi:hypothetical protein
MNNKKDELFLNDLCDKYGSDKGTNVDQSGKAWPFHNYTKVYAEIFSSIKNDNLIIFECGIGTNNVNLPSNMGPDGKPGASLRVWRDYFLNANIYGADVDKDILFEEDRIKTGYINQLDGKTVDELFNKFNITPDLIIDDGLHTVEAATSLYDSSFKYLKNGGIYIIEDIFLEEIQDVVKHISSKSNDDIKVYESIDGNTRIDNNLIVVYKK